MTEEIESYDKNSPEIREIVLKCMTSTKLFAKTFFPDDVPAAFSSLHDKIFDIIDADSKKKAIAAPRGLGKTTIAKIRVCKAILFREVSFIIYLSNSEKAAEMQTEGIKRMLQTNEIVKKLFGNIKFGHDGVDDTFSKQSWTAYGDVFILPRGAGQQVRGLNWMGHRPGLVVIDDLETLESVRSDEQRDKLKKWFLSDLMKTESRYGKPATFLYIDTIKHQEALLQQFIDAEDWHSVVLSICDENFNTYDANYMTTEEIKQSYEEHKAIGETDLFFMEFMNIPISLKDAVFKEEYFKYFDDEHDRLKIIESGETSYYKVSNMTHVILVDPARTHKLHSADSAIVCTAIDRKSGKIFVRDVVAGKFTPDQLYDLMFEMVLRFKATLLCVEVTGLHSFISQPIENQMRVRGIYCRYIELNAKGHKEDRIATLAPNYRIGYMYHNKSNCQSLELQLLWFPKSKRLDIMDALAYINLVMEQEFIYFDPSNKEDDFSELGEFDELENDLILSDEWRVV